MNTPSSIPIHNNENMPSNNILVALQILPLLPQQQNISNILESRENEVKLNIPKAPVFSFDLVLDSNSQKEEYHQYLLKKIPKLTIDQLIQGHDTSIIFYDALAANNRFDTRIILELAPLFELQDHEIYVKYTEYNGLHVQDLISAGKSNSHKLEYRIDTIDLALKYYIFGSEQHTKGTSSIYSIILRHQSKTTHFNLIDLSACPHETLMQFSNYCANRNTTVPFTQVIEKSSSCIFIGCVSPLDSILQLQQTLTFASTVYNQLNHKIKHHFIDSKSPVSPVSQDDPAYLKSVIVKLSNEVNVLRSHSLSASTLSSKHGSMFSSLSHSTSGTLPDIAEEEKEHAVADLYRQIEELENQMTVTKERNAHVEHELATMRTTNMDLWSLNEKQSTMIDVLELRINQMQDDTVHSSMDMRRGMEELFNERYEMEKTLQVVENLVLKQDNETTKALEELIVLQKQCEYQRINSDDTDSLGGQRTRALENRVEELDNYIQNLQVQQNQQEETEKWKHASIIQSAKATALEKKIESLQEELDIQRKTVRDNDVSGLVANLEGHIARLEQEKSSIEIDFETSYEAAINEMEKVTQLANQQSHQIQQLETALADAHLQLGDKQNLKQNFETLQREYELLEKINQGLKKQQPPQSQARQSTASIASVYRKRKAPNRISIDEKPQLMNWMQERLSKSCTVDVLQKVSHMADENRQLAILVDDLENQLMSQRYHLSQQVKTLECEVMNLTVLNNQLERQIETPSRLNQVEPPTRISQIELPPRMSRSSVALLRLRREETASVHSDMSRYRSTTPNVPPPTEPPSQPLPPTPTTTTTTATSTTDHHHDSQQLRTYKHKVEIAENQVRAHQTHIKKLETQINNVEGKQQEIQEQFSAAQKDLDFERRQKQKAEKAHAILEKRLQDVMNKKNKFLCF